MRGHINRGRSMCCTVHALYLPRRLQRSPFFIFWLSQFVVFVKAHVVCFAKILHWPFCNGGYWFAIYIYCSCTYLSLHNNHASIFLMFHIFNYYKNELQWTDVGVFYLIWSKLICQWEEFCWTLIYKLTKKKSKL